MKIVLRVLAAVLLLVGGLVLYVQLRGMPRYPVEQVSLHVESTPERIERGRKLAAFTCVTCHADPSTGLLTGKRRTDVPSVLGEAYSANITAHRDKGIGGWTDGELAVLLRTGVSRDGRLVPPWMVRLPHLSDEDLASLIAFLRSDDPQLAPSEVEPGLSRPSLLIKLLSLTVFEKLPYPKQPIVAPPLSDKVAHGRYLITALGCHDCHSADFKKVDKLVPEKSVGYLGGGNELLDLRGRPIPSANLTPDPETGIGTWSEANFSRALRDGFRPDGTVLRYPMMPMKQFSDAEVAAMYAYLRTVPSLHNRVVRVTESESAPITDANPKGRQLYYSYGCVSCHGENGVGVADLRQAGKHYGTHAQIEQWIRHAPEVKPGSRMPAWDGVIRDDDYEPLIAYVLQLGEVSR